MRSAPIVAPRWGSDLGGGFESQGVALGWYVQALRATGKLSPHGPAYP